jgi:hypothetical protein
LFALDTLELRRGVGAGAAGLYDSAAVRAGVVSLIGTGLLGWSGWAALRFVRDDAVRRREGAPLIVDAHGPRGGLS